MITVLFKNSYNVCKKVRMCDVHLYCSHKMTKFCSTSSLLSGVNRMQIVLVSSFLEQRAT